MHLYCMCIHAETELPSEMNKVEKVDQIFHPLIFMP